MKVCIILIKLKWVSVVNLLSVILFLFLGMEKFYYSIIEWDISIFSIWNSYSLLCFWIIKHLIFSVRFVSLQNTNVLCFNESHINHLKPFTLIHSDIWGPSCICNHTHNKWSVAFIDYYTCVCWVYLKKIEVWNVFNSFHTMI